MVDAGSVIASDSDGQDSSGRKVNRITPDLAVQCVVLLATPFLIPLLMQSRLAFFAWTVSFC